MEYSLGTFEEVLCTSDFDLNVIEVQPYSGAGKARFIEIYNQGGAMDAYGIHLSGMYTGDISTSTVVSQGYILLISED